jgi:nucleoside-diphosphate-sugar epimerase
VAENQPILPVDHNGISKRATEQYHLLYHNLYGLWTTCLRMTNVYGPRMRIKDDHQNFLGWWIHLILVGKSLPVYGDGQQSRDLNYMDDVITALLNAVTNLSAQGQVYNLGAQAISLLDLAQLLIELNGSGYLELVPFPQDRSRIEIGHYAGDYTKIQNQLGWEPRVALRDGLQKTLDYYRQYGAHYED